MSRTLLSSEFVDLGDESAEWLPEEQRELSAGIGPLTTTMTATIHVSRSPAVHLDRRRCGT
jgi:hypothetical protein